MKTVKYWEAVKAYQENGTLSRVVGHTSYHNPMTLFTVNTRQAFDVEWELQPVKKKITYKWWIVFNKDGSIQLCFDETIASRGGFREGFVEWRAYKHEIEVDE